MAEQPRSRGRRPPRPPAPEAPAPRRPVAGPGRREVAPIGYQAHLESEHNLRITPEPGWPTEYKRFFLSRVSDGTEKRIATTKGTRPEAVAHFYFLLHPEQRPSRGPR